MRLPFWAPRTPLVSASPAVILPLPSAVKEPTKARNPTPLYPRKLKAYCPTRRESFPELEQAGATALMVMLSCWVEVSCGTLVSETVAVKEYVPGVAVGMPEIAPVVGLSANPDGSSPVVTVQLR